MITVHCGQGMYAFYTPHQPSFIHISCIPQNFNNHWDHNTPAWHITVPRARQFAVELAVACVIRLVVSSVLRCVHCICPPRIYF